MGSKIVYGGVGKMKCACGHRLKEIKTEMELLDGDVIIKNTPAYYCSKCNEELLTSEQVEKARGRLKELVPIEAFKLRKRVIKVGNVLAIPIPKDIAEFFNVSKGSEFEFILKSRKRAILDLA